MKEFMDKDFLLETETAKHLFHDYAEPWLTTIATFLPKMFMKTCALITWLRSGSAVKIRTEATSVTTTNGV